MPSFSMVACLRAVEITDRTVPFDGDGGGLAEVGQRLSRHQREKRAEDVAADRRVAGVVDRPPAQLRPARPLPERGGAGAERRSEDRDAAAVIWGLIERIVLTPSEKWAEMDAVLHGDLGAILERAGNGGENMKTDIPMPELSVSVVAWLDLRTCDLQDTSQTALSGTQDRMWS
ncbi:MAG: hypothetical protein OXI95_08455 [bacterium]|nr:hypothetical protein [bacterium]